MTLDINRLSQLSTDTLNELVTGNGIYASSAKGIRGRYHGYFGRDSSITAAFIQESKSAATQKRYLPLAANSLINLSQWQGRKDNEETGEQYGKIPHEIRKNPDDYQHLTTGYIKRGLKLGQ
jgi:glycogen debranching enzyme